MAYIDHQQLTALEAKIPHAKPTVAWSSAGRSHAGKVRLLNEDAFINSSQRGLWAVADGMGGRARGDYASGVVVEALVHFEQQPTLTASIQNLEARLAEAHDLCRNSFKGEKVGTTVAALYSYGGYCFYLWAGDSRIYRLRGGVLTLVTQDHSVAQERCARGELTLAQAEIHPGAHVLTRAVGVHQTLHLDLHYEPVQPADRYLICSDGLYNEVSMKDIEQCLEHSSPEEAAEVLIDRALDNGGNDNVTALVVDAHSV